MPGSGTRGATCWKVCAEEAERAVAAAIPGHQLVFGQSGRMFSAGMQFLARLSAAPEPRGCGQHIWPGGSTGPAVGLVKCSCTYMRWPAHGALPKMPKNMAETLKN